MEFAKSTGALAIGITDAKTSPLVDIADIKLYAKSDMVAFLDSLVAPLSLINALVVSVGIKAKDDVCDTFRRLESIWAEYGIYKRIDG
jgi:DNA-binding MurR/RpiR family transcriptional regulator